MECLFLFLPHIFHSFYHELGFSCYHLLYASRKYAKILISYFFPPYTVFTLVFLFHILAPFVISTLLLLYHSHLILSLNILYWLEQILFKHNKSTLLLEC